MSRVAKVPILIPESIKIQKEQKTMHISGAKGRSLFDIDDSVNVEIKGSFVKVEPRDSSAKSISMSGTTRSILSNMILGVSVGYKETVELVGVGYKASLIGGYLSLSLGYSHTIKVEVPKEVKVSTEKNNLIHIECHDKQMLGSFVALLKRQRKIEPYKGKGVRIKGQFVFRKEGKKK